MKLVGATGDWTAKTMTNAYPAIRGVYSLVGSPDRVEADVFDFPHNYNQTSRNAVYAFMGRWLLGIDDAGEHPRGRADSPRSPRTSAPSTTTHPAPTDRKTPEQLEADLIETLGQPDRRPRPGATTPGDWEAARRLLRRA